MASAAPAPPTILESILLWSANRPDWQRDALRRIVQKRKLDETDITELATASANTVSRNPTVPWPYKPTGIRPR
jgi:hypothetical protein